MRPSRGFLSRLLVEFCATVLMGGETPPSADPYDLARPFVRTFGVEAGLPSAVVYGLSRDSHGRIWAATQDGAAVFDGLRWTPVTPPEAKGPVRAILHAQDGTLWLGYEGNGLWRYREGAWSHFLAGVGINTLVESRQVRPGVYAGTRGMGLQRWEDPAWVKVQEGLDTPWVWALREFPGPDGVPALWACSQQGLWRCQGRQWERLGSEFRQLDQCNGVQPIPGPNGRTRLRVGLWRNGLGHWDGRTWTFDSQREGFPTRLPTSLFGPPFESGAARAEFAGTYDQGLALLERGRWRTLDGARGGSLGAVYCGLPDPGSRATVWLGTRDRGVGILALDGWRTLGIQEGLPFETVTAMAEGARGLWVGTTRGLCVVTGGRVQQVSARGGPRSLVNGLLSERNAQGEERLWVTTPEGLLRLEGGRWHVERGPAGPFFQGYSLLRSTGGGRNRLWLSTEEGLACLEEGRWRTYGLKEGLPGAWVYALAESPGALWLGMRDRGVVRFQDGAWTEMPLSRNPGTAWCNGLLPTRDPRGRQWLWAAFVGQGVGRLEIGREQAGWKLWDPSNLPGFPSASAFSLSVDGRGRLIVATRGGLARITLQDGPSGPEPAGLEVFTEGDGLPSSSLSAFANLVDRRGRVWVGTGRGLGVLDPALEVPPVLPPPPFLESIEADGLLLPVGNGLRFDHRQRRFRARFQWPLARRREDARFRTQLLGLETEPGPWREEAEREFTGLSAGRYSLRLWARDHLGREVRPVDWAFEVLPAPWAAWWAWTIYGVAVAGCGFWIVRWRTRRLENQAHALENVIDARTRDIAEALQEVMSAKTIAEFEREDARAAREEAEQARHRAEEASRSKSNFLANMSHEIRTPMNAVMGLSQLGQKLDLDPKGREYFQKIGTASRSLLAIINDILDFSKVEAGRLELEVVPFRLSKIFSNVQALFEQSAREKALSMEFVVEPGTPDALVGDPLRLGQVLINLTGNALKFTHFGGIKVSAGPASRPEEPLRLRFAVQDSGIGMTPAQLSKTFEPFAQADSSTTRKYGGTGLGLSISRRLVELMGGELAASSEPDRGSTFSFQLPFRPATAEHIATLLKEETPSEGSDHSNLGNLRVLLVEDIPINQEVAREILAGWQISPRIASSGAEALRILEREAFDLVLMDVQMPEMDGYETTARIRRLPSHAALPILAMTANAMDQDRQACLEAGMNDFVAKPIETDRLLAALRRWGPEGWGAVGPTPAAPAPGFDPPTDLPLADRAGALRRLGGNEGLLDRLLGEFTREQTKSGSALRSAFDQGDSQSAQRLAHTLKGVAGNLGLRRLEGAAGLVETALRGNAPAAAAAELPRLEASLAATLKFLANRQAGGGE